MAVNDMVDVIDTHNSNLESQRRLLISDLMRLEMIKRKRLLSKIFELDDLISKCD